MLIEHQQAIFHPTLKINKLDGIVNFKNKKNFQENYFIYDLTALNWQKQYLSIRMWFLTFVLPTNSYGSAKIRILFRVVGRTVYTLKKNPKDKCQSNIT